MVFGLTLDAASVPWCKLYLYFPCKGPKGFLIIRSDVNQKAGWNYLFLVIITCISERGARQGVLRLGHEAWRWGCMHLSLNRWRRRKREMSRLSWEEEQRWHGSLGRGMAWQRKVVLVNLTQLVRELAVRLTARSPKHDGRASSSSLMVQPFLVHCNTQAKHRLAHKKEFTLFYL